MDRPFEGAFCLPKVCEFFYPMISGVLLENVRDDFHEFLPIFNTHDVT